MANDNPNDRRRIGRRCHFTDPKTGKVIEGIYRKGRKVEVLTRMTRTATGFDIEETTYSVPGRVPITFGKAVDRD